MARRFSGLSQYHAVVHSCNEAFYLDEGQRFEHWCGRCDKCCFIDLVLSPFTPPEVLAGIFDSREPLADTTLLPTVRSLVGLGEADKPWECVGDVDESRTAAVLAVERPDRSSNLVLTQLADAFGGEAAAARSAANRFLQPLSDHAVPDDLLTAALV